MIVLERSNQNTSRKYTHASRQGQSCLLARNFARFVGHLSQLIYTLQSLRPIVKSKRRAKSIIYRFCVQKKFRIMTHAIDCFFISYMMDT